MRSISVTTTSPGWQSTTPSGVPVRIRSPGDSVMKRLKYSMRKGASKIMSRVLPGCVTVPLTVVLQRERHRVGHVGCVDEPGAQRRAGVAVLHAQVGAVPVLEVVADGVVVGHRVAADEVVGVVALHVLRGLADHDGELAFVVHELHVGRAVRELAVADERALALDEHQRFFGRLEFEFLRVVGVVEAEREDGAGARQWARAAAAT